MAPVCPYCRTEIDLASPDRRFCGACGTPHHRECWDENGGCTVFGCSRAPADEPKVSVSGEDLAAAAAATPMTDTTGVAPPPMPGMESTGVPPPPVAFAPTFGGYAAPPPVTFAYEIRSRVTYVVLAVVTGPLGVHNFYAGYNTRGGIQLAVSVLSCLAGVPLVWIWALVEAGIVTEDAAGVKFS